MAAKRGGEVWPGEHPLMSNRTLRGMFAGLVRARALVAPSGRGEGRLPLRAAKADVACFVSVSAGLKREDLVFGCRMDVAPREGVSASSAGAVLGDGVERLYAGIGASLALRGTGSGRRSRVAVVFCERHEVGGEAWFGGLRRSAELPLLVVVLPRWKGAEDDLDLCGAARGAGVPGIAVDADDAIAVYRVVQESLVRARAGGGAALIEGVRLPGAMDRDAVAGQARARGGEAVAGLGRYLLRRGVVTEEWIAGVRQKAGDEVSKTVRERS